jgi:hypothetical protein
VTVSQDGGLCNCKKVKLRKKKKIFNNITLVLAGVVVFEMPVDDALMVNALVVDTVLVTIIDVPLVVLNVSVIVETRTSTCDVSTSDSLTAVPVVGAAQA